MLILESLPCGPFATNAIVLGCSDTRKGVIIDPAPESHARLLEVIQAKGLTIDAIWLTHSHWDHIGDLAAIKEELGVPIYVHPADAENVRTPGSDGLPLMFPISGVEPEHELKEGQKLSLGKLQAEVIHTPGHTPGGVCFYFESDKVLISGDTLFQGSIGNLSFPTADPEAMWQSLKKLATLPPETRVYPGHGGATTIGAENWLDRAEEIFR